MTRDNVIPKKVPMGNSLRAHARLHAHPSSTLDLDHSCLKDNKTLIEKTSPLWGSDAKTPGWGTGLI